MEISSKNKMGTVPVFKLLISMSAPAMFSMFIQAMYNIVDSIFVSMQGEDALTAVSFAFPMQMLIIAFAIGTGVGVNSLVSRKLGEKNFEEANHAVNHGLVLSFITWIIFAIAGMFFSETFISFFVDEAANPEIFKMATDYLRVVMVLSIGVFIGVSIEKSLQATGNMIFPMFLQLAGAIINIILDPILIFGYFGFPALGVLGAAIATVIGQIVSMGIGIFIICKKKFDVKFSLKNFKFDFKIVKYIYIVGIPSIIMQSIASILITGINKIIADLHGSAVAVLGVYYKLQSFVFMPVFGLMQGLMPILGYNYGARNKSRFISALKYACVIASLIMTLGTLLFVLIPNKLLGMFNASEAMYQVGIPAFRTISISFIPAAIGITFSTLFQAIGQGGKSLLISFLRQLVVILPVAKFLSSFGIMAVWYAYPIAEVVSFVVSILIFMSIYKNKIKNLNNPSLAMQNK